MKKPVYRYYKQYPCQTCGELFESYKGSKTRTPKFCSKVCYKKSFATYVSENTKTCRHCETVKPLDDFYKSRRGIPASYCKPCHNLRSQAARQADPDHQLKRHNYYLANKEEIVKKSKKWCAQNPDKRKAIEKRWAEANPEKCQDRVRRRRARRRAAGGSFTSEEWARLCRSFNHRCVACEERKPLTVDHVIPVSLGGTSYIANIQPLCLSCNSGKRDRAIDYRLPWKKIGPEFKKLIDQKLKAHAPTWEALAKL